MKKIEDDFVESKRIIRCHKFYFVNLSKVVTTSGNARVLYPISMSKIFKFQFHEIFLKI